MTTTPVPKRKIMVELEFEISNEQGDYLVTKFSHPDLQGHLYLRASSNNLMRVQLDHIDAVRKPITDPITTIINGANKLVESATELKELMNKK